MVLGIAAPTWSDIAAMGAALLILIGSGLQALEALKRYDAELNRIAGALVDSAQVPLRIAGSTEYATLGPIGIAYFALYVLVGATLMTATRLWDMTTRRRRPTHREFQEWLQNADVDRIVRNARPGEKIGPQLPDLMAERRRIRVFLRAAISWSMIMLGSFCAVISEAIHIMLDFS
jgi:hypothetical protein